jgi:low temperature requirement protein LtrA
VRVSTTESSALSAAHGLSHHVTRMAGRDPHESGRVATSLELLFDLCFVVAFGVAGNEAAHLLAEGHFGAGLFGFSFAMFAVVWAWINFSWFASAFDTDDWIYRVTTLIQMVGVLILALGLPPMFASLDHGTTVDNRVMVLGYVVMRVAMVAQWLRAARQSPERRRACLTYVAAIVLAQLGWIVVIVLNTSVPVTAVLIVGLLAIEFVGPAVAERAKGGTPWHAHHIAERYGLLTIIALGEGIVGTVAALSASVQEQGWTLDAALVGLAGTGLTFGMWWMYFVNPAGEMLHHHRERSFGWGYGHILLYAGIAGTGAGLHVAAYYIEHEAHIGAVATVLTVAVPVALYIVMVFVLYSLLVRAVDPFHWWLLAGTAVFLVAPVLLAAVGVSMAVCLVVLMLAPAVTVVGYETVGHRHQAALLEHAAD